MKKSKVLIAAVVAMLISLCFAIGAGAATANLAAVSKVKAVATTNSATISWSKVKNAGGYKITEKVKGKWVTKVTTTSSACIITDLKAGKKYTYRITAYGKKGSSNLSKNYKTVNVYVKPAKVKGLKATAKGTTVTLKWNKAEGATAYRVYKYNSSKKTWSTLVKSTSKCTATIKNLKKGTKYTFAVRSFAKASDKTISSAEYTKVTITTSGSSVKVPSSKAEIAKAYNKAVNNLKDYQGTVTMTEFSDLKIELTELSVPAVKSTVHNIIDNLAGTTENTYTFKKGVDVYGGGEIRNKIAPWGRDACVTASDLKSAKAVKTSSGGYKMTLVFPAEKMKFDGTKTTGGTHHKKALDLVDLGTLDLGPTSIANATTNYYGATIVATVDKKGRLIEVNVENPFSMSCQMKVSFIDARIGLGGRNNEYIKMNYDSNKAPQLNVPTTTAPTTSYYDETITTVQYVPSTSN